MLKKDSKKNFSILLSVFIFLFLISLVSASHRVNQPMEVVVSCSGFTCADINITIYDPVSEIVVDDQPMTSHNYYANYSLTPILNGNYTFFYSDGENSSSGSFEVTPSGHSNLTTFLFVFLAIIFLVFILGVSLKNNWIMMFGSMLVLFFGFWLIIYGIDLIKDTTTTWAIALIVWAVGIYGLYLSAEGQLAEGFRR